MVPVEARRTPEGFAVASDESGDCVAVPSPGVAPSPRPDRLPATLLIHLSHDQLLHFTYGLQDDVSALRVTLQEAVTALADVTADRDRLRRAVRSR